MSHAVLRRRFLRRRRPVHPWSDETVAGNRARRRMLIEPLEDRRLLTINVFNHVFKELTLGLPDGSAERVLLGGTATVSTELDETGAAADTDDDRLDQVATELVALDLRGSSSLGPVRVGLSSSQPSVGEIEEGANDETGILDLPPYTEAGWAESFFDVFVEVEIGGQMLQTVAPENLTATLFSWPPAIGETYSMIPGESIALVDANGRPTGLSIIDQSLTLEPERQIDVFPSVRKELVWQLPDGTTERVRLSGSATVATWTDWEGRAADTDGDGRDQVPTELVELDLVGTSSKGLVHVSLDPSSVSSGEIEEQVNGVSGQLELSPFSPTGSADSFFDVFVEIDVGGNVLHPAVPEHLQAVITQLPPGPGEVYATPASMRPIELLDPENKPAEFKILREAVTPVPEMLVEDLPYVQKELVLLTPQGETETVLLGGSATVQIGTDDSGWASDPDGDGLDQVDAELLALDLAGWSSVGPVYVRLGDRPAKGQIIEQANHTPGVLDVAPYTMTGSVDSFFDVFVEIEIGGQILQAADAERLGAVLTQLPPDPGAEYTTPVDMPRVDLLFGGEPTGYAILSERLVPNPEREIDRFPYVEKEMVLQLADGTLERVLLRGTATIEVGIDPSGMAADTDGDGLDQVPSELVALNLSGESSLGPVLVGLNPMHPSSGEIEELINNTPGTLDVPPFSATGSAFSFFDVFLQVEIGGKKLVADGPERLRTVITHKPPAPGETYVTPPGMQPLPLVSLVSTGEPGGTGDQEPVMWIVSERLTPEPRGAIRVVKDAEPDDSQDFSFTSPDLGDFALDDDSDPTLPSSRLFNNLEPGEYTVTELLPGGWNLASVVIDDPDGGSSVDLSSGTATIDLDPGQQITVTFTNRENQPPVADPDGPYYVDEGGSLQLDGSGSADDMGIVRYEWDFDHDGIVFDTDAEGVQPTFPATALDGPHDVTIGLRVTDDELQADIGTAMVHVRNVAPTVSDLDLTAEIDEGDTATLSGTVTDAAPADVLTLELDWGDGTTQVIPLTTPLPTGVSYDATSGAFSVEHRYVDDGPSPGNGTAADRYVVTGRVVDDDGGEAPLRRSTGPRIANELNATGWSVTQQILSGEPIGQTFRAISNNPLETISFYIADMNASVAPADDSLTFSLYEGEGTSGQLLGSREVTGLTDDFSGFLAADFSSVTLVHGQMYTAVVTNDTARWGRRAGGNQYAGGTAIYAGAASPTSDALFRVQWQADRPEPRIANQVNDSGWSVTQQILAGEPLGQSFQAISDNPLSKISFYVADMNASAAPTDDSLDLALYEGIGTGGRLLGTRAITDLGDGFSGFVSADFSSVTLVDGDVYTAVLTNDTARWGRMAIGNQYAGGTAIYAGAASPTSDALFAVEWQADPDEPRIANEDNQTGWSVTQQILVGEPIGQTFTAIAENRLSSISFHVADMNASAGPADDSLEFKLYEGVGVSGRLLGTREVTGLSDGFSGFISADFGAVTLVDGQVYTATVSNDTARWGRTAIGNQYAGGTAIYAGAPSPTSDALFRVTWQADPPAPEIANEDNQTGWSVTQQILAGEPLGQTFTAISDNRLSTVSFYVADMNTSVAPEDHSLTFALYEGEGTGGLLLATREYTGLSDGYSGFISADFSSVTLVDGQVYTAVLTNDTARWGRMAIGNQYAGGTAIYAGAASPTSDALFRVRWQPDSPVPVLTNDDNQTGWSVTQQILAGEPIGQTFTAISDNRMSDVSFYVADMNASEAPEDGTIGFSLYEGTGTSGRLLGTRESSELPDGFSGFVAVDFSSVTLVDGRVYTAALTNETARWGRLAAGNQYAGGVSLYAGGLSPTADSLFRLGWQPDPSLLTVVVNNVTPDFDAGPDEPAGTGHLARTINFTDPGEQDVHTVTVDYGDGSPLETIAVPLDDRQFDLGHSYSESGDFTVTVTVADDDLGHLTDDFLVPVRLLDWGDAPELPDAGGYPTTAASSGASHWIRGPWLGDASDRPDAEADGQPDPNALGDDLAPAAGSDDEDGVVFPPLVAGQTGYVFIQVHTDATMEAYVDGWIDFNGDRQWDASERFVGGMFGHGMHHVPVTVPNTAVPGTTFARVRVSSSGGLDPTGPADSGEVEDHLVRIITLPENTKWVQLPDLSPRGIDVQMDPVTMLADDFACRSTSLLTDVHLWGSWKEDVIGEIRNIEIRIHPDDPIGPAGTDAENNYSKPEPDVLWTMDFGPGEFSEDLVYQVPEPGEYWWDPETGELVPGGDSEVWRIDIPIDPDKAFLQRGTEDAPVIYWLDVRVTTENGQFGWKTRQWPDHFMDDAVWTSTMPPLHWQELQYPPGHPYHEQDRNSIDLAFALTFEEVAASTDWGDAPESAVAAGYPTTALNNGARHVIRGPWLGDANDQPDAEPDGQPDPQALGDDKAPANTDDEDGVVIPPLVRGQTNYVTFEVSQPAGSLSQAHVDGWIDFNGNRQWEAAEQFVSGWYGPGTHTVAVTPPVTGTSAASTTFARVRINSRGPLGPTGGAGDGEVEDHEVALLDLPENTKWVQLPDLTPNGIDIRIDDSRIAADDFLCEEPSLLTDVHLWGSWKSDEVGEIEKIRLSVHADDPVGDEGTDPGNTFSQPEPEELWVMDFGRDEFDLRPYYTLPGVGEYWWDPLGGDAIPDGDKTVWQIDISIDPDLAFLQQGTPERPAIYWLDVQVETQNGQFGWKTRQWPEHFMDDAVWDAGSELPRTWDELRYPDGHPYRDQDPNSIDLAFALTFQEAPKQDWGDAPDSVLASGYPTLAINGGAHHVIRGPWLGDLTDGPDAEPDGQPHPRALGDDHSLIISDDEDGVVIPPLVRGQTNYVFFEVQTAVGRPAYVEGWIDFNGDRAWTADEQFVGGWFGTGLHTVAVTPPNTSTPPTTSAAPAAATFARVRINSRGPLGPTGGALDGEVEDHEVQLREMPDNTKWVQLPDLSPNGIDIQVDDQRIAADDFLCTEPSLLTDVHLWGSWKGDENGRIQNVHLSIHADDPVGEDGTDPANEFSKPDPEVLWAMDFGPDEFKSQPYYTLPDPGEYWWDPLTGQLIAGGDRTVWQIDIPIDPREAFLQEGSEDQPVIYWLDVQVATEEGDFGWKTRQWPEHFMDDAVWDEGSELPRTWEELSYPEGHPYQGLERDSIDLAFALTFDPVAEQLDWGDAPETASAAGYPTTALNNGARHVIQGPWLGDATDKPDAEPDGQPHLNALGDDLNPTTHDDEDGVVIPPLVVGQNNFVFFEVQTLPGRSAYVDGWIDFNADRQWDSSEQFVSGWFGPGTHSVAVTPPSGSTPGHTFARVRINSRGPLKPVGPAADGEVEDHAVRLVTLPDNTKWVQLPDLSPNGIDVRVDDLRIAADDFLCTDTSLLTGVRLWGSWKEDWHGRIAGIHLSIHGDDPVGSGGSDPDNSYSQPEPEPLWTLDVGPGEFTEQPYHTLPVPGEYWWDPRTGELLAGGDRRVWQIDIPVDVQEAFLQKGTEEAPAIYWLDVSVQTEGGQFGWKTRQWPEHFMDDAVWDAGSELPRMWKELRYPEGHPYHDEDPNSIDLSFSLTFQDVPDRLDWGDAPDGGAGVAGYPTLAANNGARHIAGGPWLGDDSDRPDVEPDGQPNADAKGDDADLIYGPQPPQYDDEDGVQIPTLLRGKTAKLLLEVGGGGGVVDVWIDIDRNKVWEHPAEQVYSGWLPDGTHSIAVPVPEEAELGETFARFRISSRGGLRPDGLALDGEVEDHLVTISDPAGLQGLKFEDLDGDGERDHGELGLAGWEIVLRGTDTSGQPVVRRTITMEDDPETAVDETGVYWFRDVPAGTYTVREVMQSGWRQTAPPDSQYTVNLEPDQFIPNLDFGNQQIVKQARLRLQVSDHNGQPLEAVSLGQTFLLEAYVEDLRDNPQGVFAAYADVLYDSTLAGLIGDVGFDGPYQDGTSGDTSVPGLLNEAGAFDGQTPLGAGESLLFRIEVIARSQGQADFIPNRAEGFDHEFYLYLDAGPLDPDLVDFVATAVDIVAGAPWQNPDQPTDVNDDGITTPADVLRLVNEKNMPQYHDPGNGQLPLPKPSEAPYLDVSGDGIFTLVDVMFVVNHLNGFPQPSLPAGEGEPPLLFAPSVSTTADVFSGNDSRRLSGDAPLPYAGTLLADRGVIYPRSSNVNSTFREQLLSARSAAVAESPDPPMLSATTRDGVFEALTHREFEFGLLEESLADIADEIAVAFGRSTLWR